VGAVLTVTPTAAEAIRQLVDSSEAPESAGMRIAAGAPTDEGTPLQLAIVDGPEPGDEVVAGGEASVFLEPQVAEYLDDTVLDARVRDDKVEFALRDSRGPQPPSENGSQPQS
jgi:Fe-S cluster assembly iron-binding protein IscA